MAITREQINLNDTNCVIQGINWSQFEEIEKAFVDIEGVRFVYLDGVLEIMTLSPEHEDIKSTIGLLLEAYMRRLGTRFYTRGSATLGTKELGGRKEPDESYNFAIKKPIPELVIEVILTSGSINLLEFYQRLSVPEVWLWEDGVLQVYSLVDQKQGYQDSERSKFFPDLNLSIFAKYIIYYDQYDAVTEFMKEIS